MKLSIRLSKTGKTVNDLLKPTHALSGPLTNWNNIPNAVLYYGMGFSNPPAWADFLSGGTQTPLTGLLSSGAIALLFVPVANRYMVFTFGICISKLIFTGFERDFGLKVVLNTVDPEKIRSVDAKTVDTIITNKRTQLSKENKLQDFGFEIDKDLLNAVVGKPADQNFASIVGGSDSLQISCNITTANVFQKCQAILQAYTSAVYKTHYGWIDNIKPLKDQTVIDALDADLVSEFNNVLGGAANGALQLASPTIIDFTVIDHFKIGGYRSVTPFDMPDFEQLITDMQAKSISGVTLVKLETCRVKAFDGSAATPIIEWSLYDWIVAEVTYNANRYILSEGSWFEISPSYFTVIDTAFQKIMRSRSEYKSVGTTTHANETDYLTNYRTTASEIILDRQLVYTFGSKNTIEPCDIYNAHRQFIHVKDGGASSKLSHLFNQGLVSANAFVADHKFRKDVKAKMVANPTLAGTISDPVRTSEYTVIYRILKSGASFKLPFFTKVVLNETYRKIKLMGYKFRLEWVQKI